MNPIDTTLPGLMRRLAAMLYDSFLLFAVLCVATLPIVLLGSINQQTVATDQVVYELQSVLQQAPYLWFYRGYLLLIIIVFFSGFWIKAGQTLGMRAWRLRLYSTCSDRISLTQCLLRCFAAVLSWLCLGLGYWWILFDRQKLSWPDRLSNTRLLVVPKGG